MNQLATILLLCISVSCAQKKETPLDYQLVWNDEFDQNTIQVDESKWFMETVAPNNGSWYNNELQHYTDRTENASVSEGTFLLVNYFSG